MGQHLYFPNETKKCFEQVAHTDYHKNFCSKTSEIVRGGYILPAKKQFDPIYHIYYAGGVLNTEKEFVSLSAFQRENLSGTVSGSYDFDDNDIAYKDIDVVYAGVIINHFGHFLLEGISRLWYWVENKDKNLDIAFLVLKKQKIFPQFWEIMYLLGISKQKIHFITRPTQFKTIYVPAQAHILNTEFNDKFLIPYQYMASRLPDQPKNKIYLSRRKVKKGTKCLGEKSIERLFSDNGYKIIYPEQLNFRDQICAVKNASCLAGISGTALHLAVFASKGVKITVLERTDSPCSEQYLINQAVQADAFYVAANINPFPVDHSIGPVLLCVTDELALYCQENHYLVHSKHLNFVSSSDARQFVKDYLALYTQIDNNFYLSKSAPLCARRLLTLAGGFIPFFKWAKQKIKIWKNKRR